MSKHFIILLTSITLISSLSVLSAEDYFNTFAENKARVVEKRGNSKNYFFLNAINKDKVEIIPANATDQKMEMDASSVDYEIENTKDLVNARRYLAKKDFKSAIKLLRPIAYPYVDFVSLPEKNVRIHAVVAMLLDTILQLNQYEEAYQIFTHIPMEDVSAEFVDHSIETIRGLVLSDKVSEAVEMIGNIPVGSDKKMYIGEIVGATNMLHEKERYDDAIGIYEKLQLYLRGTDYEKEVFLWIAYCKIKLNDAQGSKYYTEKVGNLKIGDREYSLLQLIEALLLLNDKNYMDAIKHSAKAVVYCDRGNNWMPELLYTTALCYGMTTKPPVAIQIADEISLFYPDSVWATKGKELKDKMAIKLK